MKIILKYSFIFSLILLLLPNAQAAFKISPQFAVDQVLEKSYEKKLIDLDYLKNELSLAEARGVFDPTLTANTQYGKSKGDSLGGYFNDLDTTLNWGLGLNKKFFTGTDLGIQFNRYQQKSVLGFNSSSTQSSQSFQDVTTFELKQPLIGNFLGITDRKNIEINQLQLDSARLIRDEKIEDLVLETLDLYWKTYIAKETLKEAIAARTKYEALVKNLERKAKFGLSDSADYPRALSELEDHERNVKHSSLEYLNLLDQLFTIMKIAAVEDVELDVPTTLPSPPTQAPELKHIENLRNVLSAEKLVAAQKYRLQAAKFNQFPELNFIAKAEYSGLEKTPSDSFSEMTSLKKPNYVVGLEFKYLFDSEYKRGVKNQQAYILDETEALLYKEKDNKKIEIQSLYREVLANYQIAKSTLATVERRNKVVQEQERSYKQGRLDLSQLIQDYNSLFKSMSAKASAFGQYHISLNKYAALKDELLKLK